MWGRDGSNKMALHAIQGVKQFIEGNSVVKLFHQMGLLFDTTILCLDASGLFSALLYEVQNKKFQNAAKSIMFKQVGDHMLEMIFKY